MAEIFFKTFVSFFVIYGVTNFIREIIDLFFSPKRLHKDIVIVIKVLNSEDTLEGTVRMIIWKCLSISHGSFTPKILIVDMGSVDSTQIIAKHLCKDYSFISYTTYEEYIKQKDKD